MTDNTELLKQILDSSNQIIHVCELETYTMLYANKLAGTYSGDQLKPYEGLHCYEYLMGLKKPCPFCPLKDMGDKKENTTEVKSGKNVFTLKTALIEWNGKPAFVEYAWDVTDHELAKAFEENKKNQKKQQEQIERITSLNHILADFNTIIANAGLGVWHITLKKKGAPTMQVNAKMAELLAINHLVMTEEQIYASWHDRIPPESMASVNASVEEMIAGHFSENTYIWEHPEKGNIYVRCGGIGTKEEDGSIVLSGYHSDVTDIVLNDQRIKANLADARERAEKHAKDLQQQFEIVNTIAKSFNVIYYVDLTDYHFIELGSYSSHVRSVIGLQGNGKQAFEMMLQYLVVPEHVDEMREFVDLTTLNDRLKNVEWITHQFQNHEKIWVEGMFVAASRDTEGNCDHAIWCTRNIEEQKQKELTYQEELKKAAEAAEAANKAKTSFLFNMSHDIRTPMNAIMGFRDLLEKHQDDPLRRTDYLRKIKDSSLVLLSIINNVLEMARIENGTLDLNEQAWSTEQINDTLYSVFHDMMEVKGLTFTREIHVDHHFITCDQPKLRDIFINLLSNAYKYTNPGGSVHMKLEELPYDKEGWCLFRSTISDTGIGISEEYLPKLFEEFSREKNMTDAKVEGTGLGLPIVKRYVEFMGGSIEVESEKGKGSSFIVTMPHKIASEADLTTTELITPGTLNFRGKRILLAEDNDLNAEIAIELLCDAGFLVDRAEDGMVCIEKLRAAPESYYDVILMDVQMPYMNGYEATQTIRSWENNHRSQIPILAMTANAFEEDKKNAFLAGMNGHIAKPINVDRLMKVLSTVIYNTYVF